MLHDTTVPPAEKVPAGHVVGFVGSAHCLPTGHAEQLAEPATLYVPEEHVEQDVADPELNVPAAQNSGVPVTVGQ